MPFNKKVCIIADSNEFSSAPEIIEMLRNHQIPTIVEHLEIGDYHIGSYMEYTKDDVKEDLVELANKCCVSCKCKDRKCLLTNTQYFNKILNGIQYIDTEKIHGNRESTIPIHSTTHSTPIQCPNTANGDTIKLKEIICGDLYKLNLWSKGNAQCDSLMQSLYEYNCKTCVDTLIGLFEQLKADSRFPIKNQFCVAAIIERKKMNDLFASLRDDRLWKQLINMSNATRETGVRSFLMTIGGYPTYNYITKKQCTQKDYAYYAKTFETIELKTQLSFGVGFKHFATLDTFVNYMVKMVQCITTIGTSKRPVMPKKNNIRYEDIRSDIFCCIPDVGRTTGDELSDKFSVIEVANMPTNKLAEIRVGKNKRRIGESTAECIHSILAEKRKGRI